MVFALRIDARSTTTELATTHQQPIRPATVPCALDAGAEPRENATNHRQGTARLQADRVPPVRAKRISLNVSFHEILE
jgi:hypothetical protein